MLTKVERETLFQAAKQVAENAYTPYSGYRVGAAVLGKNVHIGANVENASYGASLCAERSALAAAHAAGDKTIRAIAIAFLDADGTDSSHEMVPCGLCLQWIAELAPEAEIIIYNTDGSYKFPDELPNGFTLKPLPVRVADKGKIDPQEEERKP